MSAAKPVVIRCVIGREEWSVHIDSSELDYMADWAHAMRISCLVTDALRAFDRPEMAKMRDQLLRRTSGIMDAMRALGPGHPVADILANALHNWPTASTKAAT